MRISERPMEPINETPDTNELETHLNIMLTAAEEREDMEAREKLVAALADCTSVDGITNAVKTLAEVKQSWIVKFRKTVLLNRLSGEKAVV